MTLCTAPLLFDKRRELSLTEDHQRNVSIAQDLSVVSAMKVHQCYWKQCMPNFVMYCLINCLTISFFVTGDKEEALLSPCNCSGSMLLVHKSCLERWLSASNSDHCELCMKQLPILKEARPMWQVCDSLFTFFKMFPKMNMLYFMR